MSRTDYRELCVELFGTDDVDRLRKIAELARKQNPRNAGRKRKFGAEEIARMRDLQVAGATIQQIANKFGTSRQIVSKYLHTPITAPPAQQHLFIQGVLIQLIPIWEVVDIGNLCFSVIDFL